MAVLQKCGEFLRIVGKMRPALIFIDVHSHILDDFAAINKIFTAKFAVNSKIFAVKFTVNRWLFTAHIKFTKKILCGIYFPSAIERSRAAVTASITEARKLFFSNAATPSIVVPAGEHTMSLRTAG